MKKALSISTAIAFGLLGTAALAGALFFGAPHQFAVAGLCGIATAVSVWEYKTEKRKIKAPK